ncbi:MAG: gamma-glutamylcyclotransferase [Sulfurimonas sp.]|nr:gamma-glutamylcyclotransferase [Sulfurimonas sp.]
MHTIDKLERKINALPIGKIVPFSYVDLKAVSKDTIRKYLHRLHERGMISIVKRGYFKKIEPFHEFLFVYGSLKKGFDNHRFLEKSTKRLGKASTVSKFGMFEDSFGNYPYLITKPISKIDGELYQINRKELLEEIDEFEGAPDYYQRKKIKVKTHHGVNIAYAYIRINADMPKDQKPLKVWQNNADYKVQKLNSFLEKLH